MRKLFFILIMASTITVTRGTLSFADGKILLFSIPKERVQKQSEPPRDPLILVESARKSDSFPIPTPADNIGDFWKGDDLRQSPRTLGGTERNESKNSVVDNDSEVVDKLARSFNKKLWREFYDGDIKCKNPQFARDLNAFVHRMLSDPIEKVVDQKDGSFIPSERKVGECRFFNQPKTNVIVAWNGKEDHQGIETMIVSSEEETRNGRSTAALTIIPLPGEPISIKTVGKRVFHETEKLFLSKTLPPEKEQYGVSPKIYVSDDVGAHNIFVWYSETIDDLCAQIFRYVDQKYSGRAAAAFDSEALRAIQYYFEKGFRYFAFDLTEARSSSTKAPIVYTFQSSRLYYPLVVNRVGGGDDVASFKMIIMTPGEIDANGAITELLGEDERITEANQATRIRNGSVKFSIDEIRKIAPSLNVFDKGADSVVVRSIYFYGFFDGFTKDFTASVSSNPVKMADSSRLSDDIKRSGRSDASTFEELPPKAERVESSKESKASTFEEWSRSEESSSDSEKKSDESETEKAAPQESQNTEFQNEREEESDAGNSRNDLDKQNASNADSGTQAAGDEPDSEDAPKDESTSSESGEESDESSEEEPEA